MPSLSREQVRAVDRCAIEQVGVPGVVLMENAGRNASDLIEEFFGAMAGRRVAVVAGGGNNGGDGFVVARHLAMRGCQVVTFLVSPADKIDGDAGVNLNILRNLGHDIRQIAPGEMDSLAGELGEFDLLVDAVGGTGIRGALRGELADAVVQINAAGRPVAAIDIPTGLDCDTGEALGPTVQATLTVSFVARKKGFDVTDAAEYTGQVRVADIGVPPDIAARPAWQG